MPLPRVRFTVRRMMVAVAVVALALSGGVWAARMMALSKAYEARCYELAVMRRKEGGPSVNWGHGHRPLSARQEWLRQMSIKYRYASCFPWLPVEPDPPAPPIK
jgi:hypothetical protein